MLGFESVYVPRGWIMKPLFKFGMASVSCMVFVVFLGLQSSADDLDFNALAAHLVERGTATTEGSIQYRNFSFRTTPSRYRELRGLIVESQERHNVDVPLRDLMTTSLSSDGIEPLSGFSGAVFFKGDRQRLLRSVDESFDTSRERIEQKAAELGVYAAIDDIWSEDAAYDGDSVKILRNNERLIYPVRQRGPLFDLIQLDMSLAAWEVAIEKGANIDGQVISVSHQNGRYRITYTNHPSTDRASACSYEFDPQLDFAPTRLYLVSQGRLQFEILYGYERLEEGTLPRPSVTSHASFESNGKVLVNLWLLDQWSEDVSDADLEIDLPSRFWVIDRRVGADPREYVRNLTDEATQPEQNALKTTATAFEQLHMLLDHWGEMHTAVDFNRDGLVDWQDLVILLENWE